MVVGRVSESPNPDDHWRYYTRVFQMVTELHKVGYQGLRVYPEKHHFRIHFAPSVLLTHAARSNVMSYVSENNYLSSRPAGNHRLSLAAVYGSASRDRYFDWEDTQGDSARNLANKFIERFPRIAELAFIEDWAYAGWLIRIVGELENGWVPSVPHEIQQRYGDWLSSQMHGISAEDDVKMTAGYEFMILEPFGTDVIDSDDVNRLQTTDYGSDEDLTKVRIFPLPGSDRRGRARAR